MRIWDIPPKDLCRKHLLGEHRELHGLWNIITLDKKGYSQHPETKRWVGKSAALYKRHQELVQEMTKRGYQHHTNLDASLVTGDAVQGVFINTLPEQRELLRNKDCDCFTGDPS